MKDNFTPKKYELDNVVVVYGYDIDVNLIYRCINEIDKIFYPNTSTSPEVIKNLVLKCPQFCFIVMEEDTNKIIGYLYCFPTTESTTLEFLKGQRTFRELKEDDLDVFIGKGIYNIYVASLAIIEDYHNKHVRRMLFECFLNQVISRAKFDDYINYVYMEIASDFEMEICKLFNLEKLSTNKRNRGIYGGLFDLNRFIRLDNFLALNTIYDTIHARDILKFKKDYTPLIKKSK